MVRPFSLGKVANEIAQSERVGFPMKAPEQVKAVLGEAQFRFKGPAKVYTVD